MFRCIELVPSLIWKKTSRKTDCENVTHGPYWRCHRLRSSRVFLFEKILSAFHFFLKIAPIWSWRHRLCYPLRWSQSFLWRMMSYLMMRVVTSVLQLHGLQCPLAYGVFQNAQSLPFDIFPGVNFLWLYLIYHIGLCNAFVLFLDTMRKSKTVFKMHLLFILPCTSLFWFFFWCDPDACFIPSV